MFTVRKIFHSTPCLQLLHGCLDVNYISFIGAASLSIKIKSVKIKYDCFKNCCCWWIFQFLVYPSFKSNFLDKGEISQRLLDGSPYSCVQTFMAPRCRILIIVVIPWLFIQFLQQVKRVTYKWYINCIHVSLKTNCQCWQSPDVSPTIRSTFQKDMDLYQIFFPNGPHHTEAIFL